MCVLRGRGGDTTCSSQRYLTVPAPDIRMAFLSFLDWIASAPLLEVNYCISVSLFLASGFCSVDPACLSPSQCHIDSLLLLYGKSWNWRIYFFKLVFCPLKYVLGVLIVFWHVTYILKKELVNFWRKKIVGVDGDCIKFVDQFEKNWHLRNFEWVFCPQTWCIYLCNILM